jgi:hypothetical protein
LVRLGTGAGFSADRLDPAVDLARRGELDAMILECLGERTVAFAHRDRMADPKRGYNAQLPQRMRALLPPCRAAGTVISPTWAPPIRGRPPSARSRLRAILASHGLKIACIEGDDVSRALPADTPWMDEPGTLADVDLPVVGMNAYLGVDAILPALTPAQTLSSAGGWPTRPCSSRRCCTGSAGTRPICSGSAPAPSLAT